MDKKADAAEANSIDQAKKETMAVNNVIKIEGIQKELEQLKTQLVQVRSEAQLDLNSTNTARWFKTKFESNLQCPESRRYLKDTIDAKLLSFQVSFLYEITLSEISWSLPFRSPPPIFPQVVSKW